MLIDVNDPTLNLLLNGCFYLMLGLGILTMIPWSLKAGKNRWTLTLPFLTLAVYATYELSMPSQWDIRVDLLMLWPLLLMITLIGLLRLAVIRKLRSIGA